jgi:hypothetical protein
MAKAEDPICGTEMSVWLKRCGLSKKQGAEALGRTDDTMTAWTGKNGVPPRYTRLVRLAMAAVLNNLPPFRGDR